jgi:AraC-like DNA-binding protein
MADIIRVKTISEFHRTRQLPEPEHPLISVVDYAEVQLDPAYTNHSWILDFYFISLKRNICGKIKYGQQAYDFDEGVMFFIAPGQVFRIERDPNGSPEKSGWMLLVHPDFLWKTALGKHIKDYEFFGYGVNEALFLSKKEEDTMMSIIEHIRQEYHANIDKFSQQIIVSQMETLLNYSDRFYHRQFLTRKKAGHELLTKLEEALDAYFQMEHEGLPTVQYLASQLHVSSKYLSSLLKVQTGQTAQQHIHDKVIEKAKEQLSTTQLSVSEIAYALGFEHSQSFSKLFKTKTSQSPLEFRHSFDGTSYRKNQG